MSIDSPNKLFELVLYRLSCILFLGNLFCCMLYSIIHNRLDVETKTEKMLTTPYLGSTLDMPAHAEKEGRQAADSLPQGTQVPRAPKGGAF